jgi:hypothetical protein
MKVKSEAPLALIWLEAKQKIRDRNYKSVFPEMTYEVALTIRNMGMDKFKELMEQN